ncbi:unnamed protein product, partial [Adineta steineri]
SLVLEKLFLKILTRLAPIGADGVRGAASSSSSPIETTSITITNTLTNNVNPSKKTYIIVLSTVIPTVVILLAIGIVRWKRSSSSKRNSTTGSRAFTDINKRRKANVNFELEPMDGEYSSTF